MMCEHCDNNGTDSICGVKVTEYVRAARDGETPALKLCLELQAVILFLLHEHNQTPDGWCDSWKRVCHSIWVESGLNFDFPEPAAIHVLDAFIETAGTLLFEAADRGAFVQVQTGPQVRYLWDNKIAARYFGSPDSVRDWIVSKTSPTTPKSILKRTSQDAPGSAHGGRHGHQLQQPLINPVGAKEPSLDLGTPDIKLAPGRPLPFNRPIVPIALANAALFSTADQVIHKSSGAQSGEHHPLQAIPEAIKLQQHPPGTQPQNRSQPDLVSQISQPEPENSFTAPSAPRPGSSAAFVQLPTQNAVTPGMAVSSSFSVAKPNRSAHLASDATGNPSAQDMIYTRNRLDVVSNPNGPSRASTPTTVVCSQSTLHVNSQVTVNEEPTEQALNSAVGALKLDSAPALDLASTHFQQEQTVKQRSIMVLAPRALTPTRWEDMNV
ncbi:hypothetical protein CDV36_000142 [Fusarium kuroshium]|uniref:Uncharacterized protein n=1 Tax=Fusarium kuroshium TaxID=2010991 RepID=A0A3M2SRK6_9HYPO|nr:hypothetical protein CDV36_000142 [Fusarium kuroshium]